MEYIMGLEWKPKNFNSEIERHDFWKRIKHNTKFVEVTKKQNYGEAIVRYCQCCCCIDDGCKTHGWKRFEYTPAQMEERQKAYVCKVVNQVCHHARMMFRG